MCKAMFGMVRGNEYFVFVPNFFFLNGNEFDDFNSCIWMHLKIKG